MKKTTLRQAAMKLALLACVLLSPFGLRAQQSLPYSYGFESNDLSADGWTTQNPSGLNASEFGINSSAAKTGSYGFRFSSYDDEGTNTQYLISPELSAAGGVVVQFYYKGSSSYGDEVFKVGYSTTGTNISDFTFGSEIATEGNTSWTLSDEFTFPAGTKYVAIYYYANYQYRLYVDDFTFNAPASCPKPTGLTCTATTGTPATATFSWTNGGEETDWVLEYSIASDFTDATPINISTTDLNTDGSYTITTGLTAETRYYAHLKADCGGGDESIWSDAIDFKPTNAISQTVCDGTTTNNYIPVYGNWADAYNKDEFIIPATTEGMANMVSGTISAMTFYLSSPAADSWGNALYRVFLKEVDESSFASTSYYGTNDATIVYEGALDGTQSTMTIEFSTDYEYNGGNLLVGIYEYQKGSYKSCAFYGITSTNGALYKNNSASLESITSGTLQSFIPKTTFTYLPSNTPKPKNLHYSDLSSSAATMIWEEPNITPDSYEYQYKESTTSDWPTSWTTNSTNLSVTLSLSASTTYDFRVRAVYSEGESDPVEIQFTTLPSCPAPTATLTDGSVNAHGATIQWNDMGSTGYNVRYQVSNSITVDFESGSLPDGWTANTSSTSSGVQSNQGRNNSYGFRFHYSENGATLVSPVLSGTENGVSFSFYYKRYSDDYTEGFKVGYNTDGSDVFTYGDEISVTNTSSWLQYENTFPAGTKRIAIQYVYHNAYYLHIDDIDITIPNDNWTTVNNITATNYPITSLTAETRYLAQVQSVCGSEESSWSESVSFTTDVACVAPTYLAKVGEEGAHQVALIWNENGANTNWQICLNGVEENLITVTEPDATHDDEWRVSYNLTGLDPDQGYTVKVRSNCGDEGPSQWSNAITIHTTPSCYKPTAAQVDGYDQTTATISWTRDNRNDAGETYSIWMVPGGDDDPYVLNSTTTPAVTVDNDNHTASLTGLTQHTEYVFWVGTTCANTDESVEVVPVNFTTLADCPIPVLEASGITDVTAHTANVAWTGNDQNNSYTVSYRTAAYFDGINETFETSSLPTGWSRSNTALTDDVLNGTTTINSYSSGWTSNSYGLGQYNWKMNIYNTNKYWLITPSTTLGSGFMLNFDAAITAYTSNNAPSSSEVADANSRFVVLITTDNQATWTILREWNNTGSADVLNDISNTGDNFSIDLSAYEGETVKIAFYGGQTSSGPDCDLHIDNVIIGEAVPAGAWQTVSLIPTTQSAQLTGLTANTPYEVKVEGNCANDVVSDPSDIQSFTTFAGNVAPTIGEVTDITTTSAIVSWTGAASNTLHNAFELYYSSTEAEPPVDVTNTTPGFVGGVTSPYTLQGLTPATNYKVWVRDYCGTDGTSAWAGPLTFTTECAAINLGDVDYSEDFDDITLASSYTPSSRTLPTCWSYINTSTYASNAVYPTMYYYSYTDYSHSSPNSLRFYSTYSSYSSYDPQDEYAILPEMEHMDGKQITLWARGYNASSTFKIGMMDDPTDATTFHEIAEQALTTSYVEYSFILADGNYVAIMMEAANSTTSTKGVYIDDITIADAPTCVKPSDPTFVSATTTTATLSWTAGGSETAWQIMLNDDEENLIMANTNPFTIEGLTASTTYNAKVRAYCNANDQSEWIGGIQFTTACDAIALPWTETFAEGGSRGCWTLVSNNTVNNGSGNNLFGFTTYSGKDVLVFNSWSNVSLPEDYNQYAYSPTLDASALAGAESLLVHIRYSTYGSTDKVRFGYATSDDPSNYTWSDSYYTSGYANWASYDAELPINTVKIAINYVSNGCNYKVYIDSVIVEEYHVDKAIEANKWYAIASPVHNQNYDQTLAGVTNLTTGTYDLFGYNESEGKWQAPAILEQGKGYIYRHGDDDDTRTLRFVGTPNSGTVNANVTASCADNVLKGFNLVGNPYPHEYSYSGDYYSLNANGTWAAHTSGTIGVAEGFLVKVSAAGTVDFTEGASSKSSYSAPALAFTVSNEEFEDVAYARFDNGEGLPKIGHLNSEAPMLSIPVDGRRYAIANLSDDCQSFNLVFRGVNGTYTIKQSSNQAIAYCHLIDRVAGKDIDMLRQNYTFSSNGFDPDRFMVKLSPDAQENANGNFAYWNGNNWMVEGNGTLQVFDALGRQLFSQEISNSNFEIQNSLFPAAGVYVLRMGEKTQKIVVR